MPEEIVCVECNKTVPYYTVSGCCANLDGCCEAGYCKYCEVCCPIAHDYTLPGETMSNFEKMMEALNKEFEALDREFEALQNKETQ